MRSTPHLAFAAAAVIALAAGCHASTILRRPDAQGLRDRDGRRVTADAGDRLIVTSAGGGRLALRGPVQTHGDGDAIVFESHGRRFSLEVEDIRGAVLREPAPELTAFFVITGVVATAGTIAAIALAAADEEEPPASSGSSCDSGCEVGLAWLLAILLAAL